MAAYFCQLAVPRGYSDRSMQAWNQGASVNAVAVWI